MYMMILQWNIHNLTPLIVETFLLRTVIEEQNVYTFRAL